MWSPIEGPPLDSMLDSTARFNIWGGPVRSGKTVHSLMRWLEFVLIAPYGDLWMIGRTSGSLERNILAPLKDFTGGQFSYSFSQNKAWFGGREIYIIGASNKDAEGRIRGSTAAGVYGDEVTLWPAEVFRQLGLRMSVKGAKAFYTTNPDGPYHWLKTEYIDKRRMPGNPDGLDLAYFEWPISANTTLDPEYVANLEKEYTGLWYKRFIQGLWVAAEGAIFDFWDEAIHTIRPEDMPKADYHALSIDYGTSNATAAGLFGVQRAGMPRAWLADSYYYSGRDTGRQMTDGETADALVTWLAGRTVRHVWLDPSAASFRAELQKRGFTVRPANNDVLNGIRHHAQMLHSGEYRVGSNNREFIREYSAYLWDPKATARGEDKPKKENDHGCFVAGTLISTRRGAVPIEEVAVGDEVLTRIGYRPVLAAGLTGKGVDVYEFRASTGERLTGTGNHPVFVQGKGFARLDTLRYGDTIITVWDESKRLSTRESNSAATPTLNSGPIRPTSGHMPGMSRKASNLFIGKSGAITTALSLTGGRFTTGTATPQTTTLPILNACPAPYTSPLTLDSRLVSGDGSTWSTCRKLPANGIEAQRGGPGTRAWQKRSMPPANPISAPASIAAASTKPLLKEEQVSFAPMLASRLPDVPPAWIRKLETALSVDVNIRPTATASLRPVHIVAEPEYAGKADVYNLTVADMHEYFANGVLVHNCDATRYFLLSEFPPRPEFAERAGHNARQAR